MDAEQLEFVAGAPKGTALQQPPSAENTKTTNDHF